MKFNHIGIACSDIHKSINFVKKTFNIVDSTEILTDWKGVLKFSGLEKTKKQPPFPAPHSLCEITVLLCQKVKIHPKEFFAPFP